MNKNPLPIDLLIWDFDGTLADSLGPALAAIQQMLKELGYPVLSLPEIRRHVGWGEKALVSGSLGTTDENIVRRGRETYFRIYREELQKIPLYSHVREVLELFKTKKLVVLSNKRLEFIQLILEYNGVAKLFSQILGEDNSACLKPDPCVVLELLKQYHLTPQQALFIGDMTIDIKTGQNAGTHTCAVTYGLEKKAKLAAARPDFLIDDPLELKELIK
jgi:phosphoglycolate phosphatase